MPHPVHRLAVPVLATLVILPVQASPDAQLFSRWAASCDGVERTAGVALGDLDGDGDLDAIFANGRHYAEPDWVYANDGLGTFGNRRALPNESDRSYGVALADFDRDGDLDAVVTSDAGNRSLTYLNDGRGNFTASARLGAATHARRAVAVGDIDRDADVDIVLVGVGQDHIYVNDGRGGWTERPIGSRQSAGGRATGVALADVDGDRDLDIAIPGRYEEPTVLHINDGKGSFAVTRTLGAAADDATTVAVGDMDRDGDPDIVVGHWDTPHAVYQNDGRGEFTAGATFGGREQTWSMVLGDFDLDGDLDVIVGNENVGFWSEDLNSDKSPDRFGQQPGGAPSRIYVNDGRGRLTAGEAITAGRDSTRPIAAGDLDGDGDLDVVIGNDCQPNHVFFNALRSPARKPR